MVALKTVIAATPAIAVPNAMIAQAAKKPIQIAMTVPDPIARVMTVLQKKTKKKRFITAAIAIKLRLFEDGAGGNHLLLM